MLRISIFFSVFLPSILTANLRKTYLPPTPIFKAKPALYSEKSVIYTEKPVSEASQPNTLENPWQNNELNIFNRKPDEQTTDHKQPYNERIVNIAQSSDSNQNATEKPVEIPTVEHIFLPSNRPAEYYNLQLQQSIEKPQNSAIEAYPQNEPEKPHETQLITEKPRPQPANKDSLLIDNAQQFYNLQFPALTEKPVNEHPFPYVSLDPPSINLALPIFTERSTNDRSYLRKDRLIKKKLVSLMLSMKKDLREYGRHVKSIHDAYKSETMYKIGYLTGLINKMNKRLSKLYLSVQSNNQKLDTLRILDIFEKVKTDSDIVRDLVNIMRKYLRAKRQDSQELESVKGPGPRAVASSSGISWAYYDDTMP